MKIINQIFEKPQWRKTEDGFLRCKARVLAERVMGYNKDELGEDVPGDLPEKIKMLVPKDEIINPEALKTLEGIPIVVGTHQWLNPDNTALYQMGQVSGSPRLDGDYLEVDLLITNPKAIEAIESKQVEEVSGGYRAKAVFEPGQFGLENYDAKQTDLAWNHIAIIPAGNGRGGADIRVFNNIDHKEKTMAEEKRKVRVKLKNSNRFVNVDEEVAEALENEEEQAEKTFEEVTNQLAEKQAEAAELQKTIDDLTGQIAVFKQKLDELLGSQDAMAEEKAAEMVAEQEEAEEIMENSAVLNENGEEDDTKKEEVMNAIKKVRGEKLHDLILNSLGVDTKDMSADAKKGAFKAQNMIAKKMPKKKVSGAKIMNMKRETPVTTARKERSALERLGFKVAK